MARFLNITSGPQTAQCNFFFIVETVFGFLENILINVMLHNQDLHVVVIFFAVSNEMKMVVNMIPLNDMHTHLITDKEKRNIL